MAWLSCPQLTTWAASADACDRVSPARLPRLRQGPGSGPTRRALAWRPWCAVAGGSLRVAAPVGAQPDARCRGEAAWGGAKQARQGRLGVAVVRLVGTAGPGRLPHAARVGHTGGAAKDAWARERLREARQRLTGQPAVGLWASWAPAPTRRKRRRDSGGDGVCPRKPKRRGEGRAGRADQQPPAWPAGGARPGGGPVVGGPYRRQSDATPRGPRRAQAGRRRYRKRPEGAAGRRG